MFWGIQDFDFAQIQSNLSKSNHFCQNFALFIQNATAALRRSRRNSLNKTN